MLLASLAETVYSYFQVSLRLVQRLVNNLNNCLSVVMLHSYDIKEALPGLIPTSDMGQKVATAPK